jgi:hypothetical protein
MKTKTPKRSNRVAMRAPRGIAETASLRPQYRLGDLAKRITARNRYAEADFGAPLGRELLE